LLKVDMKKRAVTRLVKEAASLGRGNLVEPEAKELLSLASVKVPRFEVVKDVAGAIEAAERIGYPIVLKLVSPDLIHKREIGGVALNIRTSSEIEERWSEMILNIADENPVAMIEGFLVEEMVPGGGAEVIVGVVKDDQFGPVVMFGIGGTPVELLKDVSFRLAPITRDDAFEMMSEVKGFPLLMGFRGESIKDLSAIADVMVRMSEIVDGTDGLKELEVNPLIVYEKGAVVVDARATLG
jgi:acetyl-CoA synthetase (ADP-forming)